MKYSFHLLGNFLRGRMSSSGPHPRTLRYLGQQEAIEIDQELFNSYKFSVDQLMELAGLSVATAVHRLYSATHSNAQVLAIAGPGNNGGDAIVAARHLKLFGFTNITLLCTRAAPKKELFANLVHQAQESGVQVTSDPGIFSADKPSLVIDGLFGFSFKPPIRPEMQPFMDILLQGGCSGTVVVSVDVPSGWDVEGGPGEEGSFMPDTLVSLTAPKKCAKWLRGRYHVLGGRFVPQKLAEKYSLNLPLYEGTDCITLLSTEET